MNTFYKTILTSTSQETSWKRQTERLKEPENWVNDRKAVPKLPQCGCLNKTLKNDTTYWHARVDEGFSKNFIHRRAKGSRWLLWEGQSVFFRDKTPWKVHQSQEISPKHIQATLSDLQSDVLINVCTYICNNDVFNGFKCSPQTKFLDIYT